MILVACEGVPALFNLTLEDLLASVEVLPLNGNVLDVTFIHPSEYECVAIVSVDNAHKPGSTTEALDDAVSL